MRDFKPTLETSGDLGFELRLQTRSTATARVTSSIDC